MAQSLSELIRNQIILDRKQDKSNRTSFNDTKCSVISYFLENVNTIFPLESIKIKTAIKKILNILRKIDLECSEEELLSNFNDILTNWIDLYNTKSVDDKNLKDVFIKPLLHISDEQILELNELFNDLNIYCDLNSLKLCFYNYPINNDYTFQPLSDGELEHVVDHIFSSPTPNHCYKIILKNSSDVRLSDSNQSTDDYYNNALDNPFHIAKWFLIECDQAIPKNKFSLITKIYHFIDNFNQSEEEIQENLCLLLGWEHINLVQKILLKRQQISVSLNELIDYWNIIKKTNRETSVFLNTLHVTSANKSKQQRFSDKYAKKINAFLKKIYDKNFNDFTINRFVQLVNKEFMIGKYSNADSELSYEDYVTQLSIHTANQNKSLLYYNGTKQSNFPNVYDMSNYHENNHSNALPENTFSMEYADYVEISVPAPTHAPPTSTDYFIEIATLSEIERMVFSNISRFNRIQSLVYHTAMETNENMLICAPTGAGKTNIALLAILREINNNRTPDNSINLNSFKAVYIAPMKALAAEITKKFRQALSCLKIKVRELTGDMKLTAQELSNTQIIVTTPEKWDVVTRKPSGDISLPLLAKLLIIDEVHLLQDERGPVIETIVARTLRLVESSQSMIRIVGLSATLPNYLDVAQFLCVNPVIGLFFFDGRFRSVPLQQTFIGITSTNYKQLESNMNKVCYDKIIESLKKNHQVMVFVHTRNATLKTALNILTTAQMENDTKYFTNSMVISSKNTQNKIQNNDLKRLLDAGLGIHHAGIARRDRDIVESLFLAGTIRVLVCTATLSWGINLPAHTVIIKGTDIYDASRGSYVPLNILDVQQIFGRAGRPQFTSLSKGEIGHAILITKHRDLDFYVKNFVSPQPIESQLLKTSLVDVINSEIALGTITNLSEAIKWLKYTYLYVRMLKNPLAYGATNKQIKNNLIDFEKKIILATIAILNKNKMIRYDNTTEYLYITGLGRIASHFYLKYSTVSMLNENFHSQLDLEQLFRLICKSSEFSSIILRGDETIELTSLPQTVRRIGVSYSSEILDAEDKILALLQCHISQYRLESFSLVSDMNYISQNCGRISRAFFEIAVANDWPTVALTLHEIFKCIELQVWMDDHPFQQFTNHFSIPSSVLKNIVDSNLTIESFRDLTCSEVGSIIRNKTFASNILSIAKSFPLLNVNSISQPITNSILNVKLVIMPNFVWNDQIIGPNKLFWILLVEDPEADHIFHYECFSISKKEVVSSTAIELNFYLPMVDPIPMQYMGRILSETYLGCDCIHYIDFNRYLLPQLETIHTNLLDIQPLPVSVIKNPLHRKIFNFDFFNPLQSQVFHTLYHTDNNVLIGAPTGSGKTIVAEFAMLRLIELLPHSKIVYIGPLKSLVRERFLDWQSRFGEILHKKVIELTGEVTNDKDEIKKSDIIVTTPEKWDGLSRSWKTRNYVKSVKLIVFDEIHLLGETRGAVLEAIVARIHSITSNSHDSSIGDVSLSKNIVHNKITFSNGIRLIALSTSTANSLDLANWLGVGEEGLFNFRPSVRPIPLEVHIAGFPGDKYCPRMNSMNKSVFEAIKTHSPSKPVLIFASSRRQTKRTAMALISLVSMEDHSKKWLKVPEEDIINLSRTLVDENLKLFLPFGIGIHHAGLDSNDRKIVEELFFNQKIQILIATSTVAWGVNFPAHLVIIKGTEYYYAKTKQYIDFPITDVLQMMGRAGRPQFDTHGVAVILVQDMKKHFYKKFLYEPFPIESHLIEFLPDHINAEIVSGEIRHKNDAFLYLKKTYLFQRIFKNPSYYGVVDYDSTDITRYMDKIVEDCFLLLEQSYCIHKNKGNVYDQGTEYIYTPTSLGRVASFYYISYKTVKLIREHISSDINIEGLLWLIAASYEFDDFPVRHNEDLINAQLAKHLPFTYQLNDKNKSSNKINYGDSHVKAHLLFQAHMSRISLPISDYDTDTRSLLDQSIRIIQAIIDVCSFCSILSATLQAIILMQCIVNGCWWYDSSLLSLPLPKKHIVSYFMKSVSNFCDVETNSVDEIYELCELVELNNKSVSTLEHLKSCLMNSHQVESIQINKIFDCLRHMPVIDFKYVIYHKAKGKEHEKVLCRRLTKNHSNIFLVEKGEHYFIDIQLKSNINNSSNNIVQNDRFAKPKDVCWFVCVGDVSRNKLYVIKRIPSFTVKKHVTLNMGIWDEDKSNQQHTFHIYLMCDAIFGLDQQYEFVLSTSEKH